MRFLSFRVIRHLLHSNHDYCWFVNPVLLINTCISYLSSSLQSSMGVCVLDDKRNQLISGGKDGTLIVWTADGQVILILFYSALV